MKRDIKLKGVSNKKCWAYFSPDGYIQVRSIGVTKSESRKFICSREHNTYFKDYERAGYILKKVILNIELC